MIKLYFKHPNNYLKDNILRLVILYEVLAKNQAFTSSMFLQHKVSVRLNLVKKLKYLKTIGEF